MLNPRTQVHLHDFLFLAIACCVGIPLLPCSFAQEVPLVYDVEHTGADFPAPPLPDIEELPVEQPLPDPFTWSNGSGRSTAFEDWSRRRTEIKAEIEHYGIGSKPPRPESIEADFKNDTLRVTMKENGETLELTARVRLPFGEGPFPAVIGIGFGGGTGSLPSDIFTSRDIATIAFNFSQVMSHTQTRGNEPINRLYPEMTHIGAYSAWPWGISRLIDGLELVEKELPIDRKRLAVTGCSFAGKMALFAGAFDERIALTIAQESGGGGAAAWRVSETLGNVETLGKTSRAWFLEDMFKFSAAVNKLPYDHHELMAMVAPRALLVLGNPDYEWLADESGYVSCRAAHEVWKTFGVGDRFGFSIVAGHPHCRLPESQRPEVEAFVDKFLLGKDNVDTSVMTHSFDLVEHEFWYDGWAKGKSTFPTLDGDDIESLAFEAEAAIFGSDWLVVTDEGTSGNQYVTVKAGLNSAETVPEGSDGELTLTFSTKKREKYYIHARVNCPSADDDSFWLKVDDGEFVSANGLGTNGWEWVKLTAFVPVPGEHKLTLKYREDGALLDKIGITTYPFGAEVFDKMNSRAQSSTSHRPLPRMDANSREAHKQLVAKTKQGTIDVYFQGDSITRRWGATDYPKLLAHWQKSFHGWNAANFAWGGDNTHHILWRMQNGELDGLAPKVVCLQAGANNLPWRGAGQASHVDDVVTGIQAIIKEFRSSFTNVPIVLTAMFPRDQNPELKPTIDSINKRLKDIAKNDQRIHWININDQLVDEQGKLLPQVSSDGLHLELAGYESWNSALKPVLTQILGAPATTDRSPPPTGNPGL